jgi:hypothetical protein
MMKLSRAQVLEAMSSGAILKKTYGIYFNYQLTFPDGTRHFIRKSVAESIRNIKNVVCIYQDKGGISYKIK